MYTKVGMEVVVFLRARKSEKFMNLVTQKPLKYIDAGTSKNNI